LRRTGKPLFSCPLSHLENPPSQPFQAVPARALLRAIHRFISAREKKPNLAIKKNPFPVRFNAPRPLTERRDQAQQTRFFTRYICFHSNPLRAFSGAVKTTQTRFIKVSV